jgi:hypothetical protein
MISRALSSGVIGLAALLAGCSHGSHNKQLATVQEARGPAQHDPCALLDPKEVEAVLGAPLAVPPFHIQGGTPQDGGESCAYWDSNFHTILVDVNWDGGAMVWKMYGSVASMANQGAKGMLHLADGSDIAGQWDEARVVNCCKFMALRGDQTVGVDFTSTTAVSVAQGARLADAALTRLDKPLPIDGTQGVEPAIAYAKEHRPKRVDPCQLLSRAEAEAVVGPLSGDPQSRNDTCVYPRTGAGNMNQEIDVTVIWFGGYSKLRETNAIMKSFAKGFGAGSGLDPGAKQVVEKAIGGSAPGSNPAWEASGSSVAGGSAAVKRDVMISVDSLGLPPAQAQAVLAKAMSKI